ncbi:hypothetical protein AB6A40_004361 [Gnathostoma spinigerum]|uniref:Uncharacterized protein n=1 Tax=Gnathostoma spinigerum TaxID=75299 RepID=A0ABD6EEF5_9BILA
MNDKESEPRPGDKDFVMRARVPRPSQKDYVVRPRSNVEGPFRGSSKTHVTSRYDRAHRDFLERTKKSKTLRAAAVSLEGRKMDI